MLINTYHGISFLEIDFLAVLFLMCISFRFFLGAFFICFFLPFLPLGELPASSKPRPRTRGGAFAHVTPRSVGSLVVLLGKLGEESHLRVRKKVVSHLIKSEYQSNTTGRRTAESVLIFRFQG